MWLKRVLGDANKIYGSVTKSLEVPQIGSLNCDRLRWVGSKTAGTASGPTGPMASGPAGRGRSRNFSGKNHSLASYYLADLLISKLISTGLGLSQSVHAAGQEIRQSFQNSCCSSLDKCISEAHILVLNFSTQISTKWCAPGLMKFVPVAARLVCLALLGSFKLCFLY